MDDFLLENNGVEMETRAGLGRVVVATKNFVSLYENVIREEAAVIWFKGFGGDTDWPAFFSEFSTLPEQTKAAILDMYHPPLKGQASTEAGKLIENLTREAHSMAMYTRYLEHQNVDLVHKLMLIVAMNAHDYLGPNRDSSASIRNYESIGGFGGATRAALFLFGSKIQHSCRPNVTYSSQTADGALEYKSIQPISQGQEISLSYLGDLFETPTYERRTKLQASKSFLCRCERCTGPDYCRVARCPKCQVVQPCAPNTGSETAAVSRDWKCMKCGVQEYVGLQEANLLKAFQAARVTRAEAPTAPLYAVRNKVIASLSQTHFLAIRIWKELSRLYASKAAFLDQIEAMTPFGSRFPMPTHLRQMKRDMTEGLSKEQLRQRAATAGLRAIALTECVASQCLGCDPGAFNHSPDYGSASPMFHACIDLMEIPVFMRPPYTKEMVSRYLPVLRGQFGEADNDAANIERNLVVNATDAGGSGSRSCENCSKITGEARLKTCARCKLVSYCSKDCQVRDWKFGHKAQCLPSAK